jgi:hypothetical protein
VAPRDGLVTVRGPGPARLLQTSEGKGRGPGSEGFTRTPEAGVSFILTLFSSVGREKLQVSLVTEIKMGKTIWVINHANDTECFL